MTPEEVGELGIAVKILTIIVKEQIVLYFIVLSRGFKQSNLTVLRLLESALQNLNSMAEK